MSDRSSVDNTSSGPWHVEYELGDGNERTGVIHICNPETECDATAIATLTKFDATEDEQKANAYLMAAAKPLYEALKELSDDLPSDEDMLASGKKPGPSLVKMRAALAKAEGKPA